LTDGKLREKRYGTADTATDIRVGPAQALVRVLSSEAGRAVLLARALERSAVISREWERWKMQG